MASATLHFDPSVLLSALVVTGCSFTPMRSGHAHLMHLWKIGRDRDGRALHSGVHCVIQNIV